MGIRHKIGGAKLTRIILRPHADSTIAGWGRNITTGLFGLTSHWQILSHNVVSSTPCDWKYMESWLDDITKRT
jgi:hypothetical protein